MEQCLAAIASADFIALDMEFSGLFTSMKKCSCIEEFYRHTSESVHKFLCLQLGVCCGRKKSQDSEWVLDPFNFYVFPSRRKIHSVDTTSFSWLREQGFDFNDWIERGYDYERLANIDCPYIKTKDTITTLGLQRVVEKIIDAEKPIIFHNGALDLLHLYDKFVADLPNELGELAVELNRLFPAGIYDTKRIAVECNLVPKGSDDPEHIRVRYTLDGLSSATSAFEAAIIPSADTRPNPLLSAAPAKPAPRIPSPTAALSCTTLNVLRRTLEKKLGRHLKLKVESNVTTSYDLKLRILTAESSPEGESTEPPSPAVESNSSPNKRARIDPIASNREHEAGFDAMLTMHLFLLELEILLSKNPGNLSARNGAALIEATSIKKAKDRLDCKGVPPGYIDFAAARRQAIDTGLSTEKPTECSAKESNNEEQYSAPLFKNKTLFRPNSTQYTKPVCEQP